jgi:hypothetical protein
VSTRSCSPRPDSRADDAANASAVDDGRHHVEDLLPNGGSVRQLAGVPRLRKEDERRKRVELFTLPVQLREELADLLAWSPDVARWGEPQPDAVHDILHLASLMGAECTGVRDGCRAQRPRRHMF